jgi:hypothetical protein
MPFLRPGNLRVAPRLQEATDVALTGTVREARFQVVGMVCETV